MPSHVIGQEFGSFSDSFYVISSAPDSVHGVVFFFDRPAMLI